MEGKLPLMGSQKLKQASIIQDHLQKNGSGEGHSPWKTAEPGRKRKPTSVTGLENLMALLLLLRPK